MRTVRRSYWGIPTLCHSRSCVKSMDGVKSASFDGVHDHGKEIFSFANMGSVNLVVRGCK